MSFRATLDTHTHTQMHTTFYLKGLYVGRGFGHNPHRLVHRPAGRSEAFSSVCVCVCWGDIGDLEVLDSISVAKQLSQTEELFPE